MAGSRLAPGELLRLLHPGELLLRHDEALIRGATHPARGLGLGPLHARSAQVQERQVVLRRSAALLRRAEPAHGIPRVRAPPFTARVHRPELGLRRRETLLGREREPADGGLVVASDARARRETGVVAV